MANNLPLSDLKTFVFAIPPLPEAKVISAHLDGELSQFDVAIVRTEREIAVLEEYRTKLTADVVTGKLNVREAASGLPDLTSEVNTILGTDLLDEETHDSEIEDSDE
jgi:type I restriction enzyme, S subunit